MKKTIIFVLTLAVALMHVLTSCENKLEFNFGTKESKLVINALMNADSINNEVYVSYSGAYGATAAHDAIVRVYVNNILKETVDQSEETKDNVGARYRIHGPFQLNDLVKIDVTTKDQNKHAWAEVKVLPKTPIEKIEASPKEYAKPILNTKFHYELKITVNDHSQGEDYYYRLIPERYIKYKRWRWKDEPDYTQEVYYTYEKRMGAYIDNDFALMDGNPIKSNDGQETAISTTYNHYGIFNNKFFKDKSYTLTISIPRMDTDHAVIRLLRISKEEYQYIKTLNTIDSDIYGEDFSEPVIFETNVNGGLGIVSLSSESSQKIQLASEENN